MDDASQPAEPDLSAVPAPSTPATHDAPAPHPAATPPAAPRNRLSAWDRRVSDRIGVTWPHPAWFAKPLGLVSISGNYGVVWYVVAAVAAWAAAGDAELALRRFAFVSGAVLACQGVTFFVKLGVRRRRPVEKDPSGGEHIRKPRSPSFPSSHASMSAVGVITLATLYPAWLWAFVALAAVLVFSRVYLRVHYVLDVLAGVALGTVFGFVFVWLVPTP